MRHIYSDLASNAQVHTGRPLGIVLISDNNKCLLCGCKLLIRKDRPSAILIYDHQLGTLPGKTYKDMYVIVNA